MAEEIGFENWRNSNFQGLVTLTLTLDPAIRHTVVHHSSTSTYIPNFIQIEETFCGRTDIRTDIFPPILLGRLLEVDVKRCTLSPAIRMIILWHTPTEFSVCHHGEGEVYKAQLPPHNYEGQGLGLMSFIQWSQFKKASISVPHLL